MNPGICEVKKQAYSIGPEVNVICELQESKSRDILSYCEQQALGMTTAAVPPMMQKDMQDIKNKDFGEKK